MAWTQAGIAHVISITPMRYSPMTELIWDGKYKDGQRVAPPVRVALPFQTVETVNESAQQRQRRLMALPT